MKDENRNPLLVNPLSPSRWGKGILYQSANGVN